MSNTIMTVEQAAALLGVRPKTVRALAAGGIIPGVKVGKPWRFDETLLREWLAAKSRENLRPCPSTNVQIPSSGRSASKSLAARLDALLESQTEPPPRSSVQGQTPLKMLQEMGGWTSLAMPMRYAHLEPGHLAQYAETSALGAAPSTKSDTVEELPKLRVAK